MADLEKVLKEFGGRYSGHYSCATYPVTARLAAAYRDNRTNELAQNQEPDVISKWVARRRAAGDVNVTRAALPWILCGVAGGLDLLARFGSAFDFARVMYVEAALFPATAFALGYLHWRDPRKSPVSRRALVAVVWLFALGTLRPLFWTLGAPLVVANLAAVVVAIGSVLVWAALRLRRIQRREIASRPETDQNPSIVGRRQHADGGADE